MDKPSGSLDQAPGSVIALGAFGVCEHGHGANYLAVMESVGANAVAHLLAAGQAAGMVHRSSKKCRDHFAVLDLLDADGDVCGGGASRPSKLGRGGRKRPSCASPARTASSVTPAPTPRSGTGGEPCQPAIAVSRSD